jgi:biopolymer transport protein ExbD
MNDNRRTGMLRRTIPQASQDEINITPMMDVVFIMLIFFVVTASFVKETGIGISRSTAAERPDESTPVATIKLDHQEHSINGTAVSLDGIESRLAQLQAEHPELRAQLVAAKGIKVATLVRAVEQVRSAKINGLAVSTF